MFALGIVPGVLRAAVAATVLLSQSAGVDRPGAGFAGHAEANQGAYHQCVICHSCQSARTRAGKPLWGGSESGGFRCYSPGGEASSFSSVSLFCLSCHDDIIAAAPPDNRGWFVNPPIHGREFDKNIEYQHHPHSVTYGQHPGLIFWPPSGHRVGSLPLFQCVADERGEGCVECASCHDLHGGEAEHMLRLSSEEHQLCDCCHARLPELSPSVYLRMQKGPVSAEDCTTCHDKTSVMIRPGH